ncbi:MAG: lipopolysaccharide assembly protein LapA domain-containing protein [Pseudomonadales bacterium]
MYAVRRALGYLLALLVVLFGLLAVNQAPVALRLLIWESPAISLFWWLLLAFVVGMLVGGVSATVAGFRRRARQRVRAQSRAPATGEKIT